MGRIWDWLGRAWVASSELWATPHRCSVAPPEKSVTNSRTDYALTHQMVGGTKAISPCVKSASAKLFLDLHTVLAPSGEERTLDAAAQVERAALWPYASAARDAHSRVYGGGWVRR